MKTSTLILLLLCSLGPLGLAAQNASIHLVIQGNLNGLPPLTVNITNLTGESRQVYLAFEWEDGSKQISPALTLKTGPNRVPLQEWVGARIAPAIPGEQAASGSWCLAVLDYKTRQELAKSCQAEVLTVNSPPHLVYPFDQEKLSTKLPVLSWVPPAPLRPGQMIQYKLRIVEVRPEQSPMVAIAQNPAFLSAEVSQQIFPFTQSDRSLKEKQRYAWQIEAYSQKHLLGRSEVWSFVYQTEAEQEEPEVSPMFVEMLPKMSSGYYPAKGKIYFVFPCRYGEEPRCQIFDDRHQALKISERALESQGENRFVLSLPPGSGLVEGNYYYLQAKNAKGEARKLRFRYLYPE